jgi:membrane glycosyltransferase
MSSHGQMVSGFEQDHAPGIPGLGVWPTERAGGERAGWLALLVLAAAVAGTAMFGSIIGVAEPTLVNLALLLLFGLLFGNLACTFFLALAGFVRDVRRRPAGPAHPPAPAALRERSRTAVVMVIRHEDLARVQAAVRVMYTRLASSGPLEPYSFFILSDSTDPEVAQAEEAALRPFVRELDPAGRVVYRRRATNDGRKSGNLAEFCARWGDRFDYMVVLDADSLLDGATIRELVRRMDAAPRLGILQVPVRPVNRESLFGRIQQFAARMYGPLLIEGLDFWLGGAAPYWGHNAIIRVAPFMRHCRLPRLPGRAPFGGEILSHDFVEGALMRRAGWEVRLATDLRGSYEELPANLIAHAARDRRWCQGNLQNLRLVFSPGLSVASRLTFAVGALAYLCAPAWVVFVVVLSLGVIPSGVAPAAEVDPFGEVGAAGFSTRALLALVVAFLFLPKLLAIIRLAVRPGALRAFGGLRAVLLSLGGESLFAALVTPIQLMLHTQFVVAILVRQAVGWNPQPRRDADTSLAEAIGVHGSHTIVGIIGSVLAYSVDPALCLWLVPTTAGLGLSIPLSIVTSRARWGQRARRLRLFMIPEEIVPPPLLRTFAATLLRYPPTPG